MNENIIENDSDLKLDNQNSLEDESFSLVLNISN